MADKLFTTYWTELSAAALAHADAVGIEDTGGLFTATDVEAALAECKTLADAAVTPAEAAAAYQPLAAVLTGTTASYTTAEASKLSGIAAGATDDTTANNHIADTTDAHDASAISIADAGTLYVAETVEAALAEVKTLADAAVTPGEAAAAYQPLAAVLTNTTASYTTAEASKLAAIEALADVTDTTNVTAAGALMDSEVDADLKTLSLPANTTISTYGASLVDDATAGDARTTLELGTMATATATDYQTKASFPGSVSVALSDMTTQITTGTVKAYWVNPYDATLTITKVRATLATAGSGATVVDVNEGAGVGTSILSTKITIDASTTDSDAAGTPPVVSDASIAADGRLTFDIDTAGTNAAGLQVTLSFTRTA